MSGLDWTYQVRQGGLMRCCLLSLDEQMVERVQAGQGSPQEGDEVTCRYCSAGNGNMIFRDGAWEWNRP